MCKTLSLILVVTAQEPSSYSSDEHRMSLHVSEVRTESLFPGMECDTPTSRSNLLGRIALSH